MKKHSFIVTINDSTHLDASLARDEVAQALQDAKDCGALPQLDFDVSFTVPNDEQDENDAKVIEAAREEHQKDGELEIDDNAVVSFSSDGGAYVAAFVWVGNDAIHAAGAFNPETDSDPIKALAEEIDIEEHVVLVAVDSEGGHCD